MSINTRELQRFYELWTPVLTALPAVINATERANELDAYVAGLEAKTESIRKGQQALVDAAQADITKATAAVAATRAEHAKAIEELNAFVAATREKREAVVSAADAKVRAASERVAAAEKEAAQAAQSQAARLVAQERAHADKMAAAAEELAAVEARVAKAEKAFAALRAKLE